MFYYITGKQLSVHLTLFLWGLKFKIEPFYVGILRRLENNPIGSKTTVVDKSSKSQKQGICWVK